MLFEPFLLVADVASSMSGDSGIGHLIGVLLVLMGLELVLGVDNILVISILVSRLPESAQNRARILGLSLAFFARIALLFGVTWLLSLSVPLGEQMPGVDAIPVLRSMSLKDLVLFSGGLFLIYKAVKEIHHVVEWTDSHAAGAGKKLDTFSAVVTQIVLLDIVFSLDSVITAVGMTETLWVIIIAVVLSFSIILAFAKPIGDFILAHPALKILALSFLLTIGVTIIMEAFHKHVPKAYIYLPMGFALGVELLQMRYSSNQLKLKKSPPPPTE